MATPHVSGTLALILSRFPEIGSDDARILLLDSTDSLDTLVGFVDGARRLNAAAPFQGVDDQPPAPVTDLVALDPESSRVDLRWTATGDDGSSGSASRYELRHAKAPIDDAGFDAATVVEGLPAPSSPGSTAQVRVGWLAATTFGPPELVIEPDSLEVDLFSGSAPTHLAVPRQYRLQP